MFALVSPEKIQLPPGSVVRLPATWQEYQSLCDWRGDGSIPRLKYRNGEVLLMSPVIPMCKIIFPIGFLKYGYLRSSNY